MKKVIITGGCGFIGSHIAEKCIEKNYEVVVIDNLRSGYLSNIEHLKEIKLIQKSIENREDIFNEFKDCDFVFNLAAMISVPESLIKPFECVNINVVGLLNILEAAKEFNIKKVVHSSSAAVYGDDPEMPKKTDMLPRPKSPYAVTKLDGEYYLRLYTDNFGLKTTSLRYFNVFGPKQDPKSAYAAAIPIFIYNALKNNDIIVYGDGEQTRDFVYIDDVVNANLLAAENPEAIGVYNVANGRTISINELAKKIIELTGSKSKIVYKETRAGDIKHSMADITTTKKELNFKPSTELNIGLEKTINYFREFYRG